MFNLIWAEISIMLRKYFQCIHFSIKISSAIARFTFITDSNNHNRISLFACQNNNKKKTFVIFFVLASRVNYRKKKMKTLSGKWTKAAFILTFFSSLPINYLSLIIFRHFSFYLPLWSFSSHSAKRLLLNFLQRKLGFGRRDGKEMKNSRGKEKKWREKKLIFNLICVNPQ